MRLINNCPESKDYYEKGCRQRKTGRILLISAGGWLVLGTVLGVIVDAANGGNIIMLWQVREIGKTLRFRRK